MTFLAALWASQRVRKVALALLVLALLAGLWAYLSARENADDQHNQEVGAELQRATDLAETIDRVETADDTREEMRDPASRARYDQCLRSARTPANCERLLPD